jgi:hypothetical protein
MDGLGWDGMGWDGMGWDGMGFGVCEGEKFPVRLACGWFCSLNRLHVVVVVVFAANCSACFESKGKLVLLAFLYTLCSVLKKAPTSAGGNLDHF